MPIAGPFYFAWVEPNETTFGSAHYRMDEYIFSAKRSITEGEKPLLELEMQNPHIGILSSGRKYWAWFAWNNGTEIVPIFFGRVVGTPVQIFEETVTIQLVADPIDYKKRIQMVAETMKQRPYYDQVFIEVGKRDDPNMILEAYAKVWDVNPVTHACTANSIIEGADGNEDFTADDHFYDSMEMTIGQPPATAILMDASVNWTQAARGIVDIGNRSYSTIAGDGIIGEWPKPLQQLGAGWSVFYADAYDTTGAESAIVASSQYAWHSGNKTHSDGDTLSTNISMSMPMGCKIADEEILTFENRIGYLDPFHKDEEGDYSPINHPPWQNSTTGYVLDWSVQTSLVLEYKAERPRTERVVFLVRADTQPVLVDPDLSEESEVINMSGADVGVPIINLLNWTTIAGTAVGIGQIIFPDDPQIPGGQTVQIAVAAGIAGTTPPEFSDIPGFTTVDGTVTWSSMGVATPPDNAVNWTPGSNVNVGQVILPQRPFYTTYQALINPGLHRFPPTGVTVSEGTYIQMSSGSFVVCTLSGMIGGSTQSATLTPTGMPSGKTYYIAVQAGLTGAEHVIPNFNETMHSRTTDGSVVWQCIGSGEIPVGGVPGDTPSPTYFATDRGKQSVEYLAALVRAKLLYRSRCVEISFDCDYHRGVNITTRKTVTLHDPRIAGGIALGKVKSAELTVSDSGMAGCRITIACCAGYGNTVEESVGGPTYVSSGYVNRGYQQYENVVTVLPSMTDLSYAPPVYASNDDGLTFPLTRNQVLLVDQVHNLTGGVARQALGSMRAAANFHLEPGTASSGLDYDYQKQRQQAMLAANSLPKLLKENPYWQEFQFKPVNAGPFNKVYNVRFSNLQIPQGIDLESDILT
jgi:hypothetical protein